MGRTIRRIISAWALLMCVPSIGLTESVHFSGLYVPDGLTCRDGQRISEEHGDLRAGYLIYDDQGRKSDDADCVYVQVQALRDTALQIVDLSCSTDGSNYRYRQILTPLSGNLLLVLSSLGDGTSTFQIYTYCGWETV